MLTEQVLGLVKQACKDGHNKDIDHKGRQERNGRLDNVVHRCLFNVPVRASVDLPADLARNPAPAKVVSL